MMIQFQAPWACLAWPLPLILAYLIKPRHPDTGFGLYFPPLERLANVILGQELKHGSISRLLAILIWTLIVIAATQPCWLGKPLALKTAGRNILLAIDLSQSMGTVDMTYQGQTLDRLRLVKTLATPFIQSRQGDRIGLIVFGSSAYLQTPLTFDKRTVITRLKETSLGLAGDMTNIGDAIGLGIKTLQPYPSSSRVMILLTDGANNTGSVDPLVAAKISAEYHIPIYTIGIGSEPTVVQTFLGPQSINPAADLDENALRQVAELTGGEYFRAKDSETLSAIYAKINRLQPIESDSQPLRPLIPLYSWPLGLALILSWLWAGWQSFRIYQGKTS